MASIAFSSLKSLPGSDFLELLKRYAKSAKKADPDGKSLSWHQDAIAIGLGFKNWSMLHKHIASITWSAMLDLKDLVLMKPGLGEYIEARTSRTIDTEEATEMMKSWARRKYSRLIDFAFYDAESENGFGWPDVDMAAELQDEFGGLFPNDLIVKVGNDLDVDEGPWGLEEYD